MAKKKASSDEERKAALVQLRADLEESERKRAAWKKRATRAESALAELETRLRQSEKRAGKALKAARAVTPADARADAPTSAAPPDLDPASTASTGAPAGPDASWTVAQLRTEGRRRGLTGISRKQKAELLEALT